MDFTLNSLAKTLGKPIDKDLVRRRKNCFSQNTHSKKKYITAISLPESSSVTTLILNEEATHLEYLYSNSVKSLQQIDFQCIASLQYLDLSNCQLTNVVIQCDAPHLKQLYLRNNQIESICLEGNFPKLQLVDVSKNKLKSIVFKGDFNSLQYLYLNDNSLKTIDLSNLKALKILHLENNQFRELTRDFIQNSLETLRLADNPLRNSIRGFTQRYNTNCLKQIRQYYTDLDKGSVLDNEHKVLLIGNGNVGKSCMVERLVYDRFQKNWHSTHGIALEQFPHQHNGIEYIFNLWDFGGQDIYHATHRLFLQSNALYLILWDLDTEKKDYTYCEEDGQTRQYENHKLNYWLHYAKNQGKGSPVIVVQTKKKSANLTEAAECTAKVAHYSKDFNFKLEFTAVDSGLKDWDSNGYNHLLISMRAAAQAHQTTNETPKNRIDLRQALRDKQKLGEKSISLEAYLVLAQAFERAVALEILENWLVFTGVVFYRKGYFEDKEQEGDARETVILDQTWAIEAIYTLYRRTTATGGYNATYYQVQKENGQFTGKILQNIWKGKYSKSEQDLFTGFMLACELCFETTQREYIDLKEAEIKQLPFEKRHFIAPQMMSETMPKSIEDSYLNKTNNWYLNYEHNLWHYGILQSFIVETQYLADTREIWQLGILLRDGDRHYALVKCLGNTVQVRVTQGSQALLNKIRNLLDRLQSGQDIKESVSTDGANYVSLEGLKVHPKENHKIKSKQGNWIPVSDFNAFLNRDEKAVFEPKTPIVSESENLSFKIMNMTIENLQENVNVQIGRNRITEAIDLIEQWANHHPEMGVKTAITQIKGDWKRLQTDDMQGTIDYKEKEIRISKIHVKLLNIKNMSNSQNDVSEPITSNNKQIPEASNVYVYGFLFVCVATIMAVALKMLSPFDSVLFIFGTFLMIMALGALQLLNDSKLSQENFMTWMKMFFAKIPGLSLFLRKPVE